MLNLYLKYMYFFLHMKKKKKYEAQDDTLFPKKQLEYFIIILNNIETFRSGLGSVDPFPF